MTRAWPVENVDPSASLARNARRILAVRIAEYYAYEPIVDDEAAITELHNLRIAAKRLRYTLELFRAVFGEPGETLIERVKAIQELLGQLHDHDVRMALVEDELGVLVSEQAAEVTRALAQAPVGAHAAIVTAALRPAPDDPRRGLLALLGRQHASRHRVYTAFLEQWRRDHAEGVRAHLVQLSSTPLPPPGATRAG